MHAKVSPGTLLMGKMEQDGRQVRMDSGPEMPQHLSEPAAEIPSWLPQRPRAGGWEEERRGEKSQPSQMQARVLTLGCLSRSSSEAKLEPQVMGWSPLATFEVSLPRSGCTLPTPMPEIAPNPGSPWG